MSRIDKTDLEKIILKHLFEDNSFFQLVIPKIESEKVFSDINTGKLLKRLKSFYSKYKTIPSYSDINVILEDDDEKKLIKEIKSKDAYLDINRESLNELTATHIRGNMWWNVVMENLHSSDITDMEDQFAVFSKFKETFKDIDKFTLVDDTGFDDIGDIDSFRDYLIQLEGAFRIKTKWKTLNHWTNGGFMKKTLNTFMAPTGIGKTMSLFNIAIDSAIKGSNVLFLSLEISKEEMKKRMYANIGDYDIRQFKDLKHFDDVVKERVVSGLKKFKGTLKIMEYGINCLTIEMFERKLEEYEAEFGFKPDMVIVDSANLLKKPHLVNSYAEGQFIGNELKRISSEFEICLLTAVQINREGSKKASSTGKTDLTDVAESYYIPMVSDFVVGVAQEEENEDEVWMTSLKNRYSGIVGQRLSLFKDVGKQKFEEIGAEETGNGFQDLSSVETYQKATTVPKKKEKFSLSNQYGGIVDSFEDGEFDDVNVDFI